MPRPAVFPTNTTLYHPVEGAYTFPAGSPDPGGLWAERPGGEPVGKNVAAETLKALAAAEETIERLNGQVERLSHDLTAQAGERDAANARAEAAEKARDEALAKAAQAQAEREGLVQERDEARSEAMKLKAAIAPLDGDGDGAPGGSKPKSK